MRTVQIIYQSHYETLIKKRSDLIDRIEMINNEIVRLKKEARSDGVELEN